MYGPSIRTLMVTPFGASNDFSLTSVVSSPDRANPARPARSASATGDVQRLTPPQPMQYGGGFAMKDRATAAPQFAEKSFFEYHLYTLQRTTTLANNSTKQIELFPSRAAVPTRARWSAGTKRMR